MPYQNHGHEAADGKGQRQLLDLRLVELKPLGHVALTEGKGAGPFQQNAADITAAQGIQ